MGNIDNDFRHQRSPIDASTIEVDAATNGGVWVIVKCCYTDIKICLDNPGQVYKLAALLVAGADKLKLPSEDGQDGKADPFSDHYEPQPVR